MSLNWPYALGFCGLLDLTFSLSPHRLCVPQDGDENEVPIRVLMKADPSRRETLQSEAEVDPMDGEQTWPTETELMEAEGQRIRSSWYFENMKGIKDNWKPNVLLVLEQLKLETSHELCPLGSPQSSYKRR